jgi:tetratricopeptide (TPR) repeat protein
LTQASQTYQEALAAYRKSKTVGGPFFPETVARLVELLVSAGKPRDTLAILEEILIEERRSFGDKNVKSVGTLVRLAQCHTLLGRSDEAARRRNEAAEIAAAASAEDLLHIPPAMSVEMQRVGLEDQLQDVCNRVLMLPATTPGKAQWLDAASWSLILAAEADHQNPALALRLAQNAKESSNQRIPGAALGPALYRVGDWNGAKTELGQAVKHDQGNQYICDLLFLGMAHQRLGDGAVAHDYYQQAVDWMSEHSPCHKNVVRIRAEADALLGQ